MKWFVIALQLLPFIQALLSATNPRAAALIPLIVDGVREAEALHTDPQAKKDHVLKLVADAAAGVSSASPVQIDPAQAVAVAGCVFQSIDAIHDIVNAHTPV